MEELIRDLVETYGPSGFEDQLREKIRAIVEPHADEIQVDAMGNLIARKQGDGSGKRVMIAAHMDEIGLMATHITEKGFVRFTNLGGIFPETLVGSRVQFASGLRGVVESEPKESWNQLQPLSKHFIDVGASSREDCPVSVGDAAGFIGDLMVNGSRYTSKAMDDRIGCVVVIEAMKRLESSPHDVYFVFSVQEEVGVRGAEAAANGIEPEVGIAVDITKTGDLPEDKPPMEVYLGKGPAIKVKDKGMIAHAGLVRLMRKRCEDAGIDYQLEILEFGGTDARSMQVAGPGSAAGCISIPTRYAHTRSETVELGDVEGCITLLVNLLEKPITFD